MINYIEIKHIEHADDFTVVLKDELSMENALDTINIFCRTAGSKINKDKISSQNLLLQQIWNNSKLLYKGNPFF